MCIIDHQAYAHDEGRRFINNLFNSGLSEEERKQKIKEELMFNSEQNKYKCPECPKFFARTDKLDDHISTVHFMERRHQCTDCGKSFAYKHGLERHVATFHVTGGNHKSTQSKENSEALHKGYLKEIQHGWMIPITIESIYQIKDAMVLPLVSIP